MLVKRIMSEIIDIFVTLFILALSAKAVEWLIHSFSGDLPEFVLILYGICILVSPIIIQSLFWQNGRSIGKMYMGLVVIHQETEEPATYLIMFLREVLSKWLSVYLMTIPVFSGGLGIHEKATNTIVVRYDKTKYGKVSYRDNVER